MDQINNDINEELKSLFEENNTRIEEFLEKNIKKKTIKLSDLYQLIEEWYLNHPDFFMNFFYPKIQPLINKFFPENQIYEMERNFLKKYCLFEGENILKEFNGTVSIPDNYIDGHIYLTNYRIIVHGILKIPDELRVDRMVDKSTGYGKTFSQMVLDYEFAGPASAFVSAGLFSNYRPLGTFGSSSHDGYRPIGFNSFQGIGFTGMRLTKENSLEAKKCFGYQIPIINSSKISRKNNIVKYTATFKHQFKFKSKNRKVHFKISVSIPKGIKSKDFKKEAEDILKVLVQTITQYSTELI